MNFLTHLIIYNKLEKEKIHKISSWGCLLDIWIKLQPLNTKRKLDNFHKDMMSCFEN